MEANDNLPASEVPKIYTAEDGARPVIGYTLAVANQRQVYLHFSEPVYGDSPAAVSSIDHGRLPGPANAPAGLNTHVAGLATHGATLTLTNPILPGDIVPYATAQTVAAVNGTSVYDIGYATYNPGTYANTNDDGVPAAE